MIDYVSYDKCNGNVYVIYKLTDAEIDLLMDVKYHERLIYRYNSDTSLADSLCRKGFMTLDKKQYNTYVLTYLGNHVIDAWLQY